MNIRHNDTKIFFNVLTGGIKILSENGRFEYGRISEFSTSTEDRIKYTIGLLNIIRKLRYRQTILADARKKVIEAQICFQRH
jgi:hypothetical protein